MVRVDLDKMGNHTLLEQVLAEGVGQYEVVFPYEWFMRNHLDVAFQYIQIAFIGDTLSEAGPLIDATVVLEDPNPFVRINAKILDLTKFKEKLLWLSELFESEYDLPEAREYLWDYIDQIQNEERNSELPDFVDLYFANEIAANYDWQDEYKVEIAKSRPEWRYHTWKSSWSYQLGFDVYVSSYCWIMFEGGDLNKALEVAFETPGKQLQFDPPVHTAIDRTDIHLFTTTEIIRIPLHTHLHIGRVVEVIGERPVEESDFFRSGDFSILDFDFRVASDLSCVTCQLGPALYMLFRDQFQALPQRYVGALTKAAQGTVDRLLDVGGESIRLKCDWSLLDDDSFENLCYDVVLRDGRFKRDKTNRMGTSRSRDGGRDILTEAVSRAGQQSLASPKWIIQCKFSKSRKSIGRNDVMVAELIEEYGPAGIIVATNILIDSGAIDKFERTSNRNGVPIECWSGLYLERFLNRNPDLFQRYFGNDGIAVPPTGNGEETTKPLSQ